MKKKWIIFSVVFLMGPFFVWPLVQKLNRKSRQQSSHLCLKGPYFIPVKMTVSRAQIPCVEVNVGGHMTTVKVDLGFCSGISLPRKLLQQLDDKLFVRQTDTFGIRGKKYYSNVYQVPEIEIGRLILSRPETEEVNPEFEKDGLLWRPVSFWEFMPEVTLYDERYDLDLPFNGLSKPSVESNEEQNAVSEIIRAPYLLKDEESSSEFGLGRIGWPLFRSFNFFMDCDNSLIAFCDSLETLKEHGYPVDEFVEVPLILDQNPNSLKVKVMTESGPMLCFLDTGSTKNLLNRDMEGVDNSHMIYNLDTIDQHEILNPTNSDQMVFKFGDTYDMSMFKIGDKDFGPVTFQKIKTPFDISAIIGMDFLEDKLVFIDFPKRKVYFYQK